MNAGQTVLISQSPVTVGEWRGAGYIALDPRTGAGGYLLNGGANGGQSYDRQNEVARALIWSGIPIANITIPPAKADDDICERQRVHVPLADKLALALLLAGLAALIAAQPETAPIAAPIARNELGTLIGYFVSVKRAGQPSCDVPVLIVGATVNTGNDITEVRDHIAGALGGKSPKFLTYMGPNVTHSRAWLTRRGSEPPECNTDAKGQFTGTHGMVVSECDEYPFGSTYEGGQYNYLPPNSWVSLELVSKLQNGTHGGVMRWFYDRCVPANGDFEVRTDGGVMRGEDSHGKPCYP